jgi:transcriptional regulator with XRE-family HTH domain
MSHYKTSKPDTRGTAGTDLDFAGMGKRIRTERLLHAWTITEMSKRAGMSNTALSLIETGHCSPRPQTMAKIAEVLGVTIHFLLGADERV